MGFNGDVAWITPGPEAFASPARFWALTPYYFVGMPFVLADPGAQFESLPDATLDGQTYELVKVTYAAGTGDAPDDYYILYLHPGSHRLDALRYVVTYPGFAEKLGDRGRTPETLMRYARWVEVEAPGGASLRFARSLDTFVWDEAAGAVVAPRVEVEVSHLALGESVPFDAFEPPEGAVVSDAL